MKFILGYKMGNFLIRQYKIYGIQNVALKLFRKHTNRTARRPSTGPLSVGLTLDRAAPRQRIPRIARVTNRGRIRGNGGVGVAVNNRWSRATVYM